MMFFNLYIHCNNCSYPDFESLNSTLILVLDLDFFNLIFYLLCLLGFSYFSFLFLYTSLENNRLTSFLAIKLEDLEPRPLPRPTRPPLIRRNATLNFLELLGRPNNGGSNNDPNNPGSGSAPSGDNNSNNTAPSGDNNSTNNPGSDSTPSASENNNNTQNNNNNTEGSGDPSAKN